MTVCALFATMVAYGVCLAGFAAKLPFLYVCLLLLNEIICACAVCMFSRNKETTTSREILTIISESGILIFVNMISVLFARRISICGFFKDTNKTFRVLFAPEGHKFCCQKENTTKRVQCKQSDKLL